jgi:hypothetical protein
MEPELKAAIGEVSAAAKEAAAAAREATEAARDATSAARAASEGLDAVRNIAIKNHQDVTRSILALNRNFGVLWRRVNGSDPPAADPNVAPVEIPPSDAPPPLDEVAAQALAKASSATLETEALEARVILGFAKTDTELSDIRKELGKQSKAMGLGVRGFKYLTTRAGASVAVAVITLLCTILGVISAWRGHDQHPAAPQIIYVPVATAAHP